MKALPIRWKFALWTALASGLTLAIFAAGTVVNLYRERIRDADRLLTDETGEILQAVTSHPANAADFLPDSAFSWARLDRAGRFVRRDPLLTDALTLRMAAHARPATYDAGRIAWRATTCDLPDGKLVVAYNLDEVHDLIGDLLFSYALSLPLVAMATALGGWWVAGRALRPIRALAAAAEAIRPDRLDQRVPESTANDEIRRLAATLNAMLVRLEHSFDQAKRFAADASHELRTPLAIMRGEIEAILRRADLAPAGEAQLLSLQQEISRLDRITEQLLLLARFDAGQVKLAREPIDFSALIAEVCEDAEVLAAAHDVTLTTSIAPDLWVTGDPQQLRRVLLNLLDNAAKYNRSGGTIHCALCSHHGQAHLALANTGPGIPREARAQIFQRFFRADPSRAARRGHGLGLSLCREIALAHGGTLELAEDDSPGLTEFRLALALGLPAVAPANAVVIES
jgi:heavy metal sensor kinase